MTEFLTGPFWIGTTVVLAAGVLGVLLARAPNAQQRIGELAVGGTLLWIGLAVVPLPRWSPPTQRDPSRIVVQERRPASQPVHHASPPPVVATGTDLRPAPPPSEPVVPRTPIDWAAVAGGAWVLGFALSGAWLVFGALGLSRLLRRSRRAPERIERLVATHAARHTLRRRPRILIATHVERPFCCGIVRPTIVLPASLCADANDATLLSVLGHELTHLARGDVRGRLLFCLATPFLCVHPLFWWLRHRSQLAAELVADDAAAREHGASDYVRSLIEMFERRGSGSFANRPATIPAFGGETVFYRRMKMLLQREQPLAIDCSRSQRAVRLTAAIVVLGLTTALWGTAPTAAQDRPAPTAANQDESIREHLRTTRAQVNFVKAPLADWMNYLSVVSGVSVVATPAARKADATTLEGVSLPECSIATALDIACRLTDLRWDLRSGVVTLDTETANAAVAATIADLSRQNLALSQTVAELRAAIAAAPEGKSAHLIGELLQDPALARTLADMVDSAKLLTRPFEDLEREAKPAGLDATTAAVSPVTAFGPLDNRDVLDLANRAIDTRNGLERSKHALETCAKLAKENFASQSELRRLELEYRGFEQKQQVVTMLIESEIDATSGTLEALEAELASLVSPDLPRWAPLRSQRSRLRARLRILGSVH